MKKAAEQIKKIMGRSAVLMAQHVYFVDGNIFWTDGKIFYKKNINMPDLDGREVLTKDFINIFKAVKSVNAVAVDGDYIVINNNFKIKAVKKDAMSLPENVYNDDLLKDLVLKNFDPELLKNMNCTSKGKYNNVLDCFYVNDGEIAACDGNRLNILKGVETLKNDVLIYSDLLSKNLNKTVNVYCNDSYASIVAGDEIITSVRNAGQYPKYKQLIPSYPDKIKINKKDLMQVLKDIKTFVDPKTKTVVFDFKNKKIKGSKDGILTCFDYDFNFDKFDCIAFNIDYLMEMLKYTDKDVFFSMGGALRACLFESGEKTTLLMPIGLRDLDEYQLKGTPKTEKAAAVEEVKTAEPDPVEVETPAACESVEVVASFEPVEEIETVESVESPEFKKQVEKLPDDVMAVLNKTTEKMMASEEYKKIIENIKKEQIEPSEPEPAEVKKPDLKNIINKFVNKVKNKIVKNVIAPDEKYQSKHEHKNLLTDHVYSGNNAKELDKMMVKNGYNTPEWIGKHQGIKLSKQLKADACGVVIKVLYIDDDGRNFCKFEKVYNIAEFEPLQKLEDKKVYKDMVTRLKRA